MTAVTGLAGEIKVGGSHAKVGQTSAYWSTVVIRLELIHDANGIVFDLLLFKDLKLDVDDFLELALRGWKRRASRHFRVLETEKKEIE